ncbi:hypothetical protein [Candidatus Tisiphia endosymbiont of Ceraclea dissimilis]|uniref:hypothetical protein n=1 Tax=Candidatus Tisiphia endosymbiont of Ceraclea dissimilis TaxID=3077928 RepID=UPI003CCA8177
MPKLIRSNNGYKIKSPTSLDRSKKEISSFRDNNSNGKKHRKTHMSLAYGMK